MMSTIFLPMIALSYDPVSFLAVERDLYASADVLTFQNPAVRMKAKTRLHSAIEGGVLDMATLAAS